jgi:hypothetical protein
MRVRPKIQAPVPTALASKEAFNVFIESTPGETCLPVKYSTRSELSEFHEKVRRFAETSHLSKPLNERNRPVLNSCIWFAFRVEFCCGLKNDQITRRKTRPVRS